MKVLTNILISILAILAPVKAVIITSMVLVAADLVLGLMAARRRGEAITSAGFRRTAIKLFVYEMAIILGFVAETYLIGSLVPVTKIVSAFVGLTELKSIVENLNIINGSPIFKILLDKLGSANATNGDSNDKKE